MTDGTGTRVAKVATETKVETGTRETSAIREEMEITVKMVNKDPPVNKVTYNKLYEYIQRKAFT